MVRRTYFCRARPRLLGWLPVIVQAENFGTSRNSRPFKPFKDALHA
jgi:hypothetical protein